MIENNREKAAYLIVELLESFSAKELRGLQKIVSCSYFNTDRYVIKLLEVLIKKVLHQTDINQLIQLRLYNQVFSDLPAAKKELNQKQKAILRSKISSLTRLAERFISIEALEQSDQHQYDIKLNALLDKKQYRLFNKHLKKAENLAIEKQEKNNESDFKYQVEVNKFRWLYETGLLIKNDNINEIIEILDIDYLSKRMNFTINALQLRTRKPKNNYDLKVVQLIDNEVFEEHLKGAYPYLKLQMASIQLSLHETGEALTKLLGLLETNETFISREELIGYYTIALNFCTMMTRKGELQYLKNHFDIFKKMDKKKLLTIDELMPLQGMKNIVLIGCKAGEFEWVHYIIEKYTPYVNASYRMDVQKFNLGYLAFQQCNYEQAINHLLEVNNFQKSYDIDKRMLILKSYYELEKHYSEPTAQLFRSIEAFVMNNKQYTDIDKKVYKTTIRIFYNLYRYKHKVGKITLDTMTEKIEQAEYIASKTWLLEKIEELRK